MTSRCYSASFEAPDGKFTHVFESGAPGFEDMTSTENKGVAPGERTKNYIYNIIESDEPWKGRMLFTGKL